MILGYLGEYLEGIEYGYPALGDSIYTVYICIASACLTALVYIDDVTRYVPLMKI